MPRLSKRGRLIVGILIIVLILVIANITGPGREQLTFLEKAVQDIIAPIKNGAAYVYDKLRYIPLYFGGVNDIVRENEALQSEIMGLREEVGILSAAYQENVRFREILNIVEEMDAWLPTVTKVIGRDSTSWYNTITIRGGENMGFAKDMPVINAQGLVGRIQSVSRYTSEVLLLTDGRGAVSAMVQANRTPGVIESVDEYNAILELGHVPYDAVLAQGQVIVTSGLGGIFPAGLRIGYITNVTVTNGGLMHKATVRPFVDFERLEEVMVLTHIPAPLDEDDTE